MNKVKIINADSHESLEFKINYFIKDKEVINTHMNIEVVPYHDGYYHETFFGIILYKEKNNDK